MNFFENYAIVAMQSDNVTFYACKIIKVTSGFNLKKKFLSPGGATVQKTAEILQITNNSTTFTPSGVFGKVKLSTEFEFGSLVR